MSMETIQEQTFVLRASAKCFERMAKVAGDDAEQAAMHLVARSIRNAAAYAEASGDARTHRAEREVRAATA